MRLTEKQLTKHFGHLEDHQYRGYNRALGCFVENKEHFLKLMEQGKMVPLDIACELADEYDRKHPRKEYSLSPKAREIINAIKLTADKKGNIRLGSVAIRALREIGLLPTDEQIANIDKQFKNITNPTPD
jgi:hypothetical protein